VANDDGGLQSPQSIEVVREAMGAEGDEDNSVRGSGAVGGGAGACQGVTVRETVRPGNLDYLFYRDLVYGAVNPTSLP
jgi:hypothetical protein